MSKRKLFLAIAAGLFAIYVATAPYVTVYQMKSAAESHDGEALSEHIEFPSVRQSLKDQMNAVFAMKMTEDEKMKNNPFAVLGTALAGVVVDKMVDAYVTPAGITQLMAGEKPRPEAEKDSGNAGNPERKPLSNASMTYESFDKFVVKIKGDDGEKGKFVLRRRGLNWKLTDIIIPLERPTSSAPVTPVHEGTTQIALENVSQYFVPNEKEGQLFILDGKAVNRFPEARELIRIKASLFDKQGNEVATQEFMCGNVVSLYQLQVSTRADIEAALTAKDGILTNNTSVQPGASVPFMAVFFKAPNTVEEFGLEVIQSSAPQQ